MLAADSKFDGRPPTTSIAARLYTFKTPDRAAASVYMAPAPSQNGLFEQAPFAQTECARDDNQVSVHPNLILHGLSTVIYLFCTLGPEGGSDTGTSG